MCCVWVILLLQCLANSQGPSGATLLRAGFRAGAAAACSGTVQATKASASEKVHGPRGQHVAAPAVRCLFSLQGNEQGLGVARDLPGDPAVSRCESPTCAEAALSAPTALWT